MKSMLKSKKQGIHDIVQTKIRRSRKPMKNPIRFLPKWLWVKNTGYCTPLNIKPGLIDSETWRPKIAELPTAFEPFLLISCWGSYWWQPTGLISDVRNLFSGGRQCTLGSGPAFVTFRCLEVLNDIWLKLFDLYGSLGCCTRKAFWKEMFTSSLALWFDDIWCPNPN